MDMVTETIVNIIIPIMKNLPEEGFKVFKKYKFWSFFRYADAI